MSLFSRYSIIDAENIVRANVRPHHVNQDLDSLLNVLIPLTYIARSKTTATTLHRDVIRKLDSKTHTLALLKHFGYRADAGGEYRHYSTENNRENQQRTQAGTEFLNFYEDLKRMKDGRFPGFNEFIQGSLSRPSSSYSLHSSFDEQHETSLPSRVSFYPELLPLANATTVQDGNEKTLKAIRKLKESIIPRHGGTPAHSFIRRKLLVLAHRQAFPDIADWDESVIDDDIDSRVYALRDRDPNHHSQFGDEIYFECLIRTNFNIDLALKMLQNNRPNLQPPPEPEVRRTPSTTTLNTGTQCAQRHWTALNQDINENGSQPLLLQAGDEWKNATHILPAIVKLRQKANNPEVDELLFSQMTRLIYCELTQGVGPQSSLKIELLAYALFKVPHESLNHLSMVDLRDILRANDNRHVSDNFQRIAINALSQECPICMESFPRSRMENMYLCNHMVCLDCAKGYYRVTVNEINEAPVLKRLTCCLEPVEIEDDVKINFFQYLGSKMNQWFTDERLVLDRYHENLFLATKDSQVKKCSNPRCTGFFNLNNNNNQIARARCPHCQFQQCQQCCRKWFPEHLNLSCEQYAEWLFENDPDDPEVQFMKFLNTAGMMCPNNTCKAVFEYQPGGCEHFQCNRCNTEFCRVCSTVFSNPKHNTRCSRPNCPLANTIHAHCSYNCYREIRDAEVNEIIELLNSNHINYLDELRQKPEATGTECPVEGCTNPPSIACENRLCDRHYKEFLCLFIWRSQILPWTLHTDGSLRQKLVSALIPVADNATRQDLLGLAQQHLAQFLGKPKKISRARQQTTA